MGDYGLAKFDPTEPEKCTDELHVFGGSDVGTKCECGDQSVTQDDLDEMQNSPIGILIAADMFLPMVSN